MPNATPLCPTYYYGLPNSAARAFFVCKQFLTQSKPVLFITHDDTDDFEHAAREFAPASASVFTLPETDTGRTAALWQILHEKNSSFLFFH